MSKSRKHRKCPHCGSKKGFKLTIELGGVHIFEIAFNGKLLDNHRDGSDTYPYYGYCLDCGKHIDIEKLDTQNI